MGEVAKAVACLVVLLGVSELIRVYVTNNLGALFGEAAFGVAVFLGAAWRIILTSDGERTSLLATREAPSLAPWRCQLVLPLCHVCAIVAPWT